MKRTPIGNDSASALSDMLGTPEGPTWQSGTAPFDDAGAVSALTAASSVETGAGAHAGGIDLLIAAIPESDTSPAALTDADIVSRWASPPAQPAESSITEFGFSVAAAQTQEQNADQIDSAVSIHPVSGIVPASFAPVVSASLAFTNAAPPLSPMLAANHAADSFGAFAPGANVGADTIPQHGEFIDGGAPAAAPSSASPAVTALPADFAMLANPPAASDGPVTNGHVGSGGATAAQVQQALDESGLSVNGSGIKVGVLSDSFNDLGGAAADEASGALPSASHIQVLEDYASGGADEGRAMMQIVHDIAPGADLAFYTAFDSEQDFANGILALAAAGCKVICDDVSYFDEPFFQNGVIAQAIQTVEAEGVTYVTAAGNEGSNAYQAAWTPIAHTSYDGTSLSDTESFGGSPVQTITVGGNVPLVLEWNQPYGGATSNIEMLVFQNGRLVGAAQGGAQSGDPWVGVELSAGTYQIAIENLSGPNPGLIKEITFGDGIPVTLGGANIGTVYGHAMTPGAITAGAVSAADTPAFGFNSPTSESFSSSGAGTELLFANNGTALWSPDVLSPVAVSGIDDIKTTVPGGLSDFYGTSAASASLAGVAALMLSANPNLTPAQVEQIMEATALPMSNSAVSGAGLVQVDAAVAAAMLGPVVTAASLTLSQASVAASSLFTVSDPGGHTVTEYGFEDTGSGHFVLNGVVQANNQEIDVAAAQLSQLTYQSVLGAADTLAVRAEDQTGWGGWASFVATAPALIIQTDGSTSLAESVNQYFLYAAGGTSGPELQLYGADVVAGTLGGWTPIGAVKTAGGYEVAFKLPGTNLFTVWNTDSNGNYASDTMGAVPGTSTALESAETTFNQDLNGDHQVGVPTIVISTNGPAQLTQAGANYFVYPTGGTTGPELTVNGAVVVAGTLGGWVPIDVVQTAGGYEVAWKLPGTNLFTIWNTDGGGNYVSDTIGAVAGTSAALESAETAFNQDLNADGVIGLKPIIMATDVGSFGSTSLAELGSNYFLYAAGGTSGPELKLGGTAVVDGTLGGWTPIGAVETASGYEVAFTLPGTNLFTIWNEDSNGNYVSDTIGAVAGTNTALESAETTFNQDLNGDESIGVPTVVISTDGSTQLTEVGSNYFLYAAGGTNGPELKIYGTAVVAGTLGGWIPIDAVQTAGGYEVAFKLPGTNLFTIWNEDGNGNYVSDTIGAVSGTSFSLESAESSFNQDLNGDGVVGLYAAPGTALQISQPLAGASGAATIGAHATLELAAADSASVTFAASTGMLKLDQPSTFSAEISGFTGDGTLAGSDQIDLKGINYNTVQDSYANGVLTVTDGPDTVHLNFSGSYSLGNFKFASDGNGGTIVYDPPVTDSAAPAAPQPASGPGGNNIAAAAPNATLAGDGAKDTFMFPANFGHAAIDNYIAGKDTIQFDHASFATPAAALAAAHDDGHGSVVIADAAHDALTLHNITIAQLQHAHLLIA